MTRDPRAVMVRFDQLKSERGASEAYWQQVADYILPSREFTRQTTPGGKRTASMIFNTTPILANEQLAGALHGMLTSPSLRWFALRPSDPDLADDEEARAWFEAVTDRPSHAVAGTPRATLAPSGRPPATSSRESMVR